MQKDRRGGIYVVLIAFVAALGGLLFGYDTAVISGAVGFLEEFFKLTPAMTGWTVSCALIGCVAGAAFTGVLCDRLGRKKTLLIAAVFYFISAVGSALPRSLTEFIIFRIIGGLGVGAASMAAPLYIAEISPARIRGRMVSLNQFAIVTGILVVYFVNFFIERYGASVSDSWNLNYGWRWMFGSGALPSLLFFLLLFTVPESPRWLAKAGRLAEAKDILTKIDGPDHAESELSAMTGNLALENGSLKQLFEPGMRLLLVIGLTLATLQQITGINVVLYYAPEIFKDIGFSMDTALLQTIAVGAANLIFTLIAIWTVDRFGRKPLMIIGAAGMGISLLVLGTGFFLQQNGAWALVFVLGYVACFSLSLGPVVWVILSEIFPIRIRGRAMAVATVMLWIACYLISQTFPMMNDHPVLVEKFHHAFPFWVYALFCAVTIWFVLKFVPETKGRSLEEIEKMWIK